MEVLIKDEMQLAKSEVDNVEFIEHGNAALKAGGPVGNIGSVAIELIDTAKLENMLNSHPLFHDFVVTRKNSCQLVN